ncbi:MAG TPA: ABC transporter substrate-binding protein [Gaiellaceae bacterium]|jgi:polar amino acid transport system substrate-binding protein
MRRLLFLAIPLSALALTATATGGRTVAGASCPTVSDGVFTVGTDNPAYPPWFGGTPTKGSKWKVSEPTSGKGFESAVAYAVAKQLGYPKAKVVWKYVPFAKSYAPGKKPFDVDINEISVTPARAKVVDFSSSYYDVAQAVVANKGTPAASVRSLAGLRKLRLGVQLGTTSYDAIKNQIKPSSQPRVYDTNDKAVFALKSKQIDGLVVDLPTAFYVTAVQVPSSKIVGQLATKPGGEHFGMVLQNGSPLTACVNRALAKLKANGTLKKIQATWLSKVVGVPVLR